MGRSLSRSYRRQVGYRILCLLTRETNRGLSDLYDWLEQFFDVWLSRLRSPKVSSTEDRRFLRRIRSREFLATEAVAEYVAAHPNSASLKSELRLIAYEALQHVLHLSPASPLPTFEKFEARFSKRLASEVTSLKRQNDLSSGRSKHCEPGYDLDTLLFGFIDRVVDPVEIDILVLNQIDDNVFTRYIAGMILNGYTKHGIAAITNWHRMLIYKECDAIWNTLRRNYSRASE